MQSARIPAIILVIIILSALLYSCANSRSPVDPVIENSPDLSLKSLISNAAENTNRNILAMYEVVIDPVCKTLKMEPVYRTNMYHYPLTSLYPHAVRITAAGWSPNLWADIQLNHPLPGSGIDAFDPRVIAMLPANPGVCFVYPEHYIMANNKVVKEPDGYTKLWDDPVLPGNANPYVAYFKDEPNRVWSSTGNTSETRRWQMDINGFGGPIEFLLIVDISTNFPSPPQPVIDNCSEPFEIKDLRIHDGLTPSGGDASVEVSVFDWQSQSSIGGVTLEAPNVFDGIISLDYQGEGDEDNEYIYAGTISNDLGFAGKYNILAGTWDDLSGIYIYQEFNEIIFNNEVVQSIPFEGYGWDIQVNNGYAYFINEVSLQDARLAIYDIDPVETAHFVNSVPLTNHLYRLVVDSSYAYITTTKFTENNPLVIVDINPPESAHLVKEVDIEPVGWEIYVKYGYAFVGAGDQLVIVDLVPPQNASIVKTLDMPASVRSVDVAGEYAYLGVSTSLDGGLYIVDINPINSAHIVNSVSIESWTYGLTLDEQDGYVYVGSDYGTSHFYVVDVDPADSAHIVQTVDNLFFDILWLQVANDYVFVWDEWDGAQIVDIRNPETAFLKQNLDVNTPVVNYGVYGYTCTNSANFQIIDLW